MSVWRPEGTTDDIDVQETFGHLQKNDTVGVHALYLLVVSCAMP